MGGTGLEDGLPGRSPLCEEGLDELSEEAATPACGWGRGMAGRAGHTVPSAFSFSLGFAHSQSHQMLGERDPAPVPSAASCTQGSSH